MPRLNYRVITHEYKIEEHDEDGYPTGRDVGFGETFMADGDEHVLDIDGQFVRKQLNPQAWIQAGLVELVEDKPAAPKADSKDKTGDKVG